MSKIYVGNAFSLQMVSGLLDNGAVVTPEISEVDSDTVSQVLCNNNEFVSCVGHADTAKLITNILGVEVQPQRINVSLNRGDMLYVCQVVGGRLPEACTELPKGISPKWYSVEI